MFVFLLLIFFSLAVQTSDVQVYMPSLSICTPLALSWSLAALMPMISLNILLHAEKSIFSKALRLTWANIDGKQANQKRTWIAVRSPLADLIFFALKNRRKKRNKLRKRFVVLIPHYSCGCLDVFDRVCLFWTFTLYIFMWIHIFFFLQFVVCP